MKVAPETKNLQIEDFCYFSCLVVRIQLKLQGVVEDKARGDPGLDPVTLEDFLRAGLYNRSIKATPLRLDLVLGGIVKGLPYLCMLDQRGYVCRDRVAATGFAAKMILPYLKNELAKRGKEFE
jgi:20S proteasome, alpha and beta subunits